MKRLLSEIIGLSVLLACGFFGFVLYAQTVTTVQTTASPFGTKINGINIIVPKWTDWVQVDTKRTICYDIDWVDADSSTTSVDMRCETSRSSATVADAGYDIPVYTSTAATGITNSTGSTIRQTATGGGGPGTSSWTWCVTNIPGPFINCLFTGQGAPGAGDLITVYARGITP